MLSGTPTKTGAFTFNVVAMKGTDVVDEAPITFTVKGEAPKIDTTALPSGRVDVEYSAEIEASGLPKPTVEVEGLPEGLSFSPETNVISGRPTVSGKFELTIDADNGLDPAASKKLTLVVKGKPIITTVELPDAEVFTDYNASIATDDEIGAAKTFIVDDETQVPAGLVVAEDGTVSGQATALGDYEFTVYAVNDIGVSEPDTIKIKVVGEALAILTTGLADGAVGIDYSALIEAMGTPAPSITVEGLPEGLAFNAQTATIEGTPTQGGKFDVVVKASNGLVPDVEATLKLVVKADPVFVTDSLPDGFVDVDYEAQIEVSGYPAPTLRVAGLPAGLSFDKKTGKISGVPAEKGISAVTVIAVGGTQSITKELPINIDVVDETLFNNAKVNAEQKARVVADALEKAKAALDTATKAADAVAAATDPVAKAKAVQAAADAAAAAAQAAQAAVTAADEAVKAAQSAASIATTNTQKAAAAELVEAANAAKAVDAQVKASADAIKTSADSAKMAVDVKVGKTYEVDGMKHKVTKVAKGKASGAVTLVRAKNAKKVVVPAKVKLPDGRTYDVTVIAKNAFSNLNKVATVIVGANVKKIQRSAFFKTPALRKLVVKSNKLKKKASVKGAFLGPKAKTKKLKVKVPKKLKKAYKKSFSKKNLKTSKRVAVK